MRLPAAVLQSISHCRVVDRHQESTKRRRMTALTRNARSHNKTNGPPPGAHAKTMLTRSTNYP